MVPWNNAVDGGCADDQGLQSLAPGLQSFWECPSVVDVFGYYLREDQPGGLRFHPTKPVRIVDTRTGQGAGATRLGTARTATVTTPSMLFGPGTRALVTNMRLVRPTNSTYLTLWPAVAGLRPGVCKVNICAGQVVAAVTVTALDPYGRFNVYNRLGPN